MKRAVFLDRDGTIAKDVPYCSRPEDFKLLPRAAEGISLLNKIGFKVIIVTNQSGIARGYFNEDMLNKIHQKMRDDLAKFGAHIDDIYYCPHHPDDNCGCRKPKPTLIIKAAKEHRIDLGQSFMVGDKANDVKAGFAAGCRTVLLVSLTGTEAVQQETTPDFTAHDFEHALPYIMNRIE